MSPENHDLVEMLRSELRTGFGLVTAAIGETNSRIDQTNSRLDQLSIKVDGVAEKIDGIATFLIASERNIDRIQARLFKLENRVDDVERDRPA